MHSIYWYDLETFGIDPKRDRIAQFAGIRTDHQLQILDEPEIHYVKLSPECLPDPRACLVTGIVPQLVNAKGVCETDSVARILSMFSVAETCVAGYNNIRFDDEFVRYALYRNLRDPYAREWQNGNSRWDLLDVVRLTHALRPEGIQWPTHDNQSPSFKLEDLTRANQLPHQDAHDAMSDVSATLAVARLIQHKQPKLFNFAFQHRGKTALRQLLRQQSGRPLLHVSGKYAATRGCLALVAPLCAHPVNTNAIIAMDLDDDYSDAFTESPEEIAERIFTPNDQLAQGKKRLPIKLVHLNRAPVLAPLSVLDAHSIERWQLDVTRAQQHYNIVSQHTDFIQNLQRALMENQFEPDLDPEMMLYSGSFFSDQDKRQMLAILRCSPRELSQLKLQFEDGRLEQLIFRWRARNYPESLTFEETQKWIQYQRHRVLAPLGEGGLKPYQALLDELSVEASYKEREILSKLREYVMSVAKEILTAQEIG